MYQINIIYYNNKKYIYQIVGIKIIVSQIINIGTLDKVMVNISTELSTLESKQNNGKYFDYIIHNWTTTEIMFISD